MLSKCSRFIIVGLALLGALFGIYVIFLGRQTPPVPPIPFPPAKCPYPHCVAGSGAVEAHTEDIWIGVPFGEIVEKNYIESGITVEKGEPFFKLNTETLEAELVSAQASYAVALASYERELALPRPESVPPIQSAYEAAKAEYEDDFDHYLIYKNVAEPKAISMDELNRRQWASVISRYNANKAKEELELLQAGSWIRDLEISRERVKEAKAKVDEVLVNIERSTIRAPFTGLVLKDNVNEGEYVISLRDSDEPLILFGAVDPLHIRIDIDEEDVWRVIPGAKGKAFVRGNSTINFDLTYVRTIPYLVPKKSLTGEDREKVDVRVLQLIYQFDKGDQPIFAGQVLDVFLEGKPNVVNGKS